MKPQNAMPAALRYFLMLVMAAACTMIASCTKDEAMADAAASPVAAPPVLPARQEPRAAGPAAQLERDRSARSEGRQQVAEIGNVFKPTSWYVPPPPPPPQAVAQAQAVPPPPPKPVAPPVPFTYLGRYIDSAVHIVMLVKGEQVYTVSEGDTIDSNYRVERVAAGVVELTYLPLNVRQTVITGDTL